MLRVSRLPCSSSLAIIIGWNFGNVRVRRKQLISPIFSQPRFSLLQRGSADRCHHRSSAPVTHLLQTFLPGKTFFPIITREFRPPKPDPAGILHIAQAWQLEDGADSLIMVGDSMDDMVAGFKAGAATVLLSSKDNEGLEEHEYTSVAIRRLDELMGILEGGFEEKEAR